ncbi:hypothetical protein GCM10027592_25530 [Spirosoma flavus]
MCEYRGRYTDFPYFRRYSQTILTFMPEDTTDLPPFVRTWAQLYAIVIGCLVLEMLLFYGLMRWLS